MNIRRFSLLFFLTAFAYGDTPSPQHRVPHHAARFVPADLLVMTGYYEGLRFDRLQQAGPGQVVFIDNVLETGTTTATGIYNTFNMVLWEHCAFIEALFYNTYSFKLNGSYATHIGPVTYRTNADWTGRGDVQRLSSRPYTYDFDVRAERWFPIMSNFKPAFVGGWGFHMLNLNGCARTRFDAPFVGINIRSGFIQLATLDVEFDYVFSGERREKIVFVQDYDTAADSGALMMKVGAVKGPRLCIRAGLAFSEHWQFNLVYRYQKVVTGRGLLNLSAATPENQLSEGSWDEKTKLRSNAIYVGISASF